MSTDCHAGGTSMRIACMGSRPPTSSSSSMLSSDCESDPVKDTTGRMSVRSGNTRERNKGTRQAPLRQGVGGKALVENHHRSFQPRILEVRIELRQVLRHRHALVDDG